MEAPRHVIETAPWQRTVMFPERRDRSLRGALRTLADTIPDEVALREDDRTVTYAELAWMTDAVAHAVYEPVGSGPVTVIVGHGINAVVMTYGVIAAGQTMVPLDGEDPVDRLALVHRETGASVTVTDRAHLETAKSAIGGPLIVLEDVLARGQQSSALPDPDPYDLALVLFTSGSTGTPKGVMRDHATILQHGMSSTYMNGIVPGDAISFIGSFAFIGAYRSSLGVLLGGATLCMHDYRTDGLRNLPDWVVANRIAVMQFAPSVLRALTDAATASGAPRMDCVRLVTLGGEALYGRDILRARPIFGPNTVFCNRFGSSETALIAGWTIPLDIDLDEDSTLPIGEPEPWTELRIVDEDGQPVADGEPGLADAISDHASLGYWRDPELTAQRFWTLPDGRRGFHTSDRVRMRPDGLLEHLGRADDRVKVRGAMVSPSEVERLLVRLHDVVHAAVVPAPARDGGTRLVGYVVPEVGATPSAWQLRRDLAGGMPTTMVPSAIVLLDELPRTPRGKVDRRGLRPPPDIARRPYRAPVGREQILADLLGSVLAVEHVGLDDDFFDLGGDSLAAIELMSAIDEQFGIDLPPSTLLEAPTTAELAPLLNHRRARGSSTVVALQTGPPFGPRAGTGTRTPFFCVAGAGSPATSLRALAHALPGDRPCYGIQARGLEERARPDRSVEACARRYLADLRAVQPSGPYLLGGHSFGGLVAFEMACRLEAAGEQVALLTMLDALPPGSRPPIPSVTERLQRPREEKTRALRVQELAKSAMGHAQVEVELAWAGLVPRRLRQYRVFFLLARRMTRKHRTQSTFTGPMLLVHATVPDPNLPSLGSPSSAWAPFVRGPITSIAIAGTHTGIMRRPHVAELASTIDAALDAADHAQPSTTFGAAHPLAST
ncbi:MAG: non-ribosomal peptide synthetase [Acidimicrobiia bacterium]